MGYFIVPIGYGASLISNTFDICDPTSGCLDGSPATANEKQEVSATRCWVLLQNSAYTIFSAKIPPIFFFVLCCKTQQLRMFCCEIAAEEWFLQTAGLWVILDESLSVGGLYCKKTMLDLMSVVSQIFKNGLRLDNRPVCSFRYSISCLYRHMWRASILPLEPSVAVCLSSTSCCP